MRTSPDVLLALVTALALPVLALTSCGGSAGPVARAGGPRPLAPTALAPLPSTTALPSPTVAELPAAVADCVHAEVQPRSITIACGDGGVVLRGLRFDRWDARSASGRGTELRDTCIPDCAHGREAAIPVLVDLSEPRRVYGRLIFTRLALRTAAGRAVLDTPLLPLSCSVTPPTCPPSPPAGG